MKAGLRIPCLFSTLVLALSLPLLACGDETGSSDLEAQADAGGGKADDPTSRRLIFVTSTRQDGALGGAEGADAICAERASAAGLSGTYKAWLSTDTASASERLAHSDLPYRRTDGVTVADNWTDLVDGFLAAPIDRDENGDAQRSDVWTGSLTSGQVSEAGTCAGFTTNSEGLGQCGDSSATGAEWSVNLTPSCGVSLRLYCLEQ
jgi:hypothetical protein